MAGTSSQATGAKWSRKTPVGPFGGVGSDRGSLGGHVRADCHEANQKAAFVTCCLPRAQETEQCPLPSPAPQHRKGPAWAPSHFEHFLPRMPAWLPLFPFCRWLPIFGGAERRAVQKGPVVSTRAGPHADSCPLGIVQLLAGGQAESSSALSRPGSPTQGAPAPQR